MWHWIVDTVTEASPSAAGLFWLAYCAVWGWIAAQFV